MTKMMRVTAVLIGAAVGLAAAEAVLLALLPLGCLALCCGVAIWRDADRRTWLARFMGAPVHFEHAALWCLALVAHAVLIKAWL